MDKFMKFYIEYKVRNYAMKRRSVLFFTFIAWCNDNDES